MVTKWILLQSQQVQQTGRVNNLVLVILPGAGGKTSKQVIKLFDELQGCSGMFMCHMDETKPTQWRNKFSPNNKDNINAVLGAIKQSFKAHCNKVFCSIVIPLDIIW